MLSQPFTPPHPLNTAVLFLVFNRPDTTRQVFEAIRKARPPRLYVAADGPRNNKEGEAKRVAEVRQIATRVDWPCEVKTLFRDQNIGCGPAVYEAISWFFKNEEMGIILEDDCLPSQSFFWYCEELLDKYQSDQRIGMISGNNHVDSRIENTSYVFSKFFWTWGWASWRRAWVNMDFELKWEKTSYKESIIKNMGYTYGSILHWKNNIKMVRTGRVNTWDYHWFLSLSSQNQLCIFPAINLVSNVGFGDEATHTFGKAPEKYIFQKELTFPVHHPVYILPSYDFEEQFEKSNIKMPSKIRKVIPVFVKNIAKKILRKR